MANTRIFVSHSHQDNDWCSQFVDALTIAGFDVWFDKQGLYVGDQWISKLETELESRDVFLIVLTPASWSSKWVRREFELALHRNKRILGVMRQRTELTGFITTLQILDAAGIDAQRVAQQIATVLGVTVATPPPPAPMLPRSPREPRTDGVYVLVSVILNTVHCFRFYTDGHAESIVLNATLSQPEAFPPYLVERWPPLAALTHAYYSFSISGDQLTITQTSAVDTLFQSSSLRQSSSLPQSLARYVGTVTSGGDALELDLEHSIWRRKEHRRYTFIPVRFKG